MEFYAIKFGFPGERGSTFGFQRGGSTIGFQRGSPLSKCVTYLHCSLFYLREKGEGGPLIALYFTFFKKLLENHEFKVDYDP
jgi:hypothetical protein